MNNSLWLDLFRIIPVKYHHNLALVSTTGQEIIIQQFYRFDTEVVVMRARLSGSMEGSRIIMLPYAHIDYLCFTNVLPETEIQAIFGTDGGAVSLPGAAPDAAKPAESAFAAPPSPATPMPSAPPTAIAPSAPLNSPQLQARNVSPPPPPPLPIAPAPKPQATPAAATASESPTQANPGQISKSLLLARLRERLSQKK